jgi:hypothetical protein
MLLNNIKSTLTSLSLALLIGIGLNSCSSNKWSLPNFYTGTWKSEKQKIALKAKLSAGSYQNLVDSAIVVININSNKTASGAIGFARFENAEIKLNSGDPNFSGATYLVTCKKLGKIFDSDPLDSKDIEIWLSPISGRIEAQLRLVEGKKIYPMADLRLHKKR